MKHLWYTLHYMDFQNIPYTLCQELLEVGLPLQPPNHCCALWDTHLLSSGTRPGLSHPNPPAFPGASDISASGNWLGN